jgi:hypothetical protein
LLPAQKGPNPENYQATWPFGTQFTPLSNYLASSNIQTENISPLYNPATFQEFLIAGRADLNPFPQYRRSMTDNVLTTHLLLISDYKAHDDEISA